MNKALLPLRGLAHLPSQDTHRSTHRVHSPAWHWADCFKLSWMSGNNQHDDQEGEINNLTADVVARAQAWGTWGLVPWLDFLLFLGLCPPLSESLSPSLWVSCFPFSRSLSPSLRVCLPLSGSVFPLSTPCLCTPPLGLCAPSLGSLFPLGLCQWVGVLAFWVTAVRAFICL